MKTNLLLILLLSATALTTTVRAQSTETPNPDKIAIRKLLDDIGSFFDKHDLNGFASNFMNSPDVYYQITTPDNQVIAAHGIENMKKMIGGYFQSTPPVATPNTYKATDSHIRIMGSMAVVSENIDVKGNQSTHFVVLEKVADAWKILAFEGQSYAPGKYVEVK